MEGFNIPKYTFEELDITPQKRFKKSTNKYKPSNGLDTETYKGYVKLICDSLGNYKIINNIDDILHFLSNWKYRNCFNWFFNLKFDFESMIKYLDMDLLEELYFKNQVDYKLWKITYIPKKCLILREGKSATQYFFDLNNFLETSLNKASKNYLNKQKYDKIDSSRLNVDCQYWKDNLQEIIKYCLIDCELTAELGDYFMKLLQDNAHFLPQKPYSKGAYSQEYFLYNCYMPTINALNKKIIEYSYKSYSGGRFELMKRGYFDYSITYDIKSAYPFQMQNLPDYNLGSWEYVTEFCEEVLSGFYLCEIDFYNDSISPFLQRISNLNVYPNGHFIQYLTQNEIAFILKNFNNVEIDIKDGYVWYDRSLEYPLREEILKLFEWKERETDKKIRQIPKIIMNSLYGKFIQCIGGRTGKLFNPIWASEITANTRLELLKYSVGNLDKIIGFSTDSIHSTVELDVKKSKCLGDWEEDKSGHGIYIMSDVYTIFNGDMYDKDDLSIEKNKFRGFKLFTKDKDSVEKENEELTLIDILESIGDDTAYHYQTQRPVHLGEIIYHTKTQTKEDLNVWQNFNRQINLNGDKKRMWNKQFKSAYDILDNKENHYSLPILLMD